MHRGVGSTLPRKLGQFSDGINNALQTHIGRLRSKIEKPDSSAPRYIVLVREYGYRFQTS